MMKFACSVQFTSRDASQAKAWPFLAPYRPVAVVNMGGGTFESLARLNDG